MKLSVKNVKYAAFNSEETLCFRCTVYVDGKRAFEASNDGHGGPNSYTPVNYHPDNVKLLMAATEWAEAQPEIYCADLDFSYQPDLDYFVTNLVSAELRRRDRKNAYKRGCAFVRPDDDDSLEWYPLPKHLSAEKVEQLREAWMHELRKKHPDVRWIKEDGTLEQGGAS